MAPLLHRAALIMSHLSIY